MKKIIFILALILSLLIASTSIFANTDTSYAKALKYYYSGKYKEAVTLLKDYTKNKPDPSAYYLIGYALYELRQYDEANGYFKEAYLLDPKFSPVLSVSTQKRLEHKIKEGTQPSVEQISTKKPAVSASKEPQPEKQPSPEIQLQKTQEQTAAPMQPPPEPQKVEPQRSMQPPAGFPKFPEPEEGLPGMPELPMGLSALMAGFGMIVLVVEIALYIYFCLCLFLIAKTLNVTAAWTAWIPLVQIWAVVGSAGKPWWWILLLLVPLVNIFIGIYLWMCITENLNRNKWLGLLMLLPVINLVFLGILAFSKTEKKPSFAI